MVHDLVLTRHLNNAYVKEIPPEVLSLYINSQVKYTMEELKDLASVAGYPDEIMYFTNSIRNFCLLNFPTNVIRLLITPGEHLPLLAGTIQEQDRPYQNAYRWRLENLL